MSFSQQFRFVMAGALVVGSITIAPSGYSHGETELRIAALTRELETATTNVAQLFLQRGDLRREHQDWLAASADYAHAAKLSPNLPDVEVRQAGLLVDMGRLNEAQATLSKVVAQFPHQGDAFIARARIRSKLKEKGVVEDYRRGIQELANPLPEYYLELARALAADSQSADALRTLDDAVERLGPSIPIHQFALELELNKSDFSSAVRRIDKIVSLASRKEVWFARKGDILLRAELPTEAKRSFQSALKAVDALPPRLQQSPAVVKLVTHVRIALTQISKQSVAVSND